MARTKLLTDAVYSPTIAASEEAIRTQIDDSIQEVLDLALEDVTTNRKLSPTGDFRGTINGGDVTLTEPGLSGAFNAHLAENANQFNAIEFRNKENGGYSWWVYPNIIRPKGSLHDKTYLSFVNQVKETKIASLDNDTGEYESFVLQTDTVSDEHNSAAICRMPNGKILAAYSKHNTEPKIYIRKSTNVEDISIFESEIELSCSGNITYAQLAYYYSKYYLFYRINSVSWALRTSTDAATWSNEVIFLTAPAQYYIRISPCTNGVIRILTVGHPIISTDHNIKYVGFQPSTGDFTILGGVNVGNIDGTSLPILSSELSTVYSPSLGNARIFDVNLFITKPTDDMAIAHANFSNTNDCLYQVTRGNSTDGFTTSTVCEGGLPLEVPAGENYYFGGMWFEYENDKIVYVCREEDGIWYTEKYQTDDYLTWIKTQVIEMSKIKKLHRPCVPYGGGKLFYTKGIYTNFNNYETYINAIKTDITNDELAINKVNKAWGEILNPTLLNGWSGTLSISKNDLGQVHLKGNLVAGTVTLGTIITSLPAGYIPSSTVSLIVHNAASQTSIIGIIIGSSGNIIMRKPADTTIVAGNSIQIDTMFQSV
jgi:hypothetical protein